MCFIDLGKLYSYGGSILSVSQFLLLVQLPPKMKLPSKVVKIGLKIVISLQRSKSVKLTVWRFCYIMQTKKTFYFIIRKKLIQKIVFTLFFVSSLQLFSRSSVPYHAIIFPTNWLKTNKKPLPSVFNAEWSECNVKTEFSDGKIVLREIRYVRVIK